MPKSMLMGGPHEAELTCGEGYREMWFRACPDCGACVIYIQGYSVHPVDRWRLDRGSVRFDDHHCLPQLTPQQTEAVRLCEDVLRDEYSTPPAPERRALAFRLVAAFGLLPISDYPDEDDLADPNDPSICWLVDDE